jgi:hypothetical protein
MATISIDYDPNGDVELVLQHSDEDESRTYNMGLIGVKVKEVRLRVSSLRLVASSRHFKAMLDFQEGKELKQHGSVEIELCDPEDDPTAMAIILSILHEKEVYLPIDMDLPLLFKVTVLVDKYHWHDMVTPYATLWFDSLVDSLGLPEDFDDNLLTWLWMSWVFGLKEYFKTLSRVAMQDACSSIDTTNENIRLLTRALSKCHPLSRQIIICSTNIRNHSMSHEYRYRCPPAD